MYKYDQKNTITYQYENECQNKGESVGTDGFLGGSVLFTEGTNQPVRVEFVVGDDLQQLGARNVAGQRRAQRRRETTGVVQRSKRRYQSHGLRRTLIKLMNSWCECITQVWHLKKITH